MDDPRPPHLSPEPRERFAHAPFAGLALWTLAMLVVSLAAHSIPLYQVETDLVGEYIPAARELALGQLSASHLAFKGPGYPFELMLAGWLTGGHWFLAARLLSVLTAALAAWLAWRLVRRLGGSALAGFVLAALLCTPVFAHHAIEAGTDMPALALALAATVLLLESTRGGMLMIAGVCAGLAIATRTNQAFLVPAALAMLALRSDRWRALALWTLGLAVPLGAWAAVMARLPAAPQDRNYLNVAWELYGHGVPWDQFEAGAGAHFHSLRSVFAYQPGVALLKVATNLVTQRGRDLHELMPLWLGVFAIPGVVLLARQRAWRPALMFAALAALVLAPVFYNPRFALYLLPFELAAAGACVLALASRTRHALAAPVLAAALIACSALASARDLVTSLADAPRETRWAGDALRALPARGARIMARKPHVAAEAGLGFVPLAAGHTIVDLARAAHQQRVNYVFYSGLERVMRPEYAVLADSGLALPGFRQIAWRREGDHLGALYRVADVAPDSAALVSALRAVLTRDAQQPSASPEQRLFLAGQLVELAEFARANALLGALETQGARDPAVAALRSTAWLGLGDLDSSYTACARAMHYGPPTAWHWGRLGAIRARQRRWREAADCYTQAIVIEPANLECLEACGMAAIECHDYPRARSAFERCVVLAPRDVRLRRFAMGACQLAGDSGGMRQLLSEGVRAGLSAAELMGGGAPSAAH